MRISTQTQNILKKKGYKNIKEYIQELADEFEMDYHFIEDAAEMLGEDELFDGLISMLDEYQLYSDI